MDQPLVDLLAARAFPQLAQVVRTRIPSILKSWEEMVRSTVPKAGRLSEPQLRDDAPQVLEQVCKSLESDLARHTDELVEVTAAHGEVRFEQNFDLHEVLLEYNLLRTAVLRDAAEHMPRPLETGEVVAINAALDVMSRRSVQAFVQYQSRELKAATEAQSKYLSFLSHDLRGGLNGILLMIEVLKRELAGEAKFSATVNDLDTMRRSLMETVGTMDRFLHAERFRKGKVQLKAGSIHLKHLLNEAASHFSYQARDKGLELRVEVPNDCSVVSDRELLTLIVQNLISNAVKYTERGAVIIRATPLEDGCLVEVQDQGPGIASERLSTLFSAFTRGETHGQPGVGLGLSIARQAAEVLGAKIWADSEPGKGSMFHVQIPSTPPSSFSSPGIQG